MAYVIGFVDDAGSEGLAHWQMLLKIKTFAEANGWTTLRYLNPTATDETGIRELILKGVGFGGTDEIYVGFRCYQVATSDIYNMSVACFTGYVPANIFTNQPGYFESGVCAHNQRIDYWLVVNAQCIKFAFKVGVGSYQSGYTGKFFPYGTPQQYPYPVAVIGMLSNTPLTRYSDVVYTMGYSGQGDKPNGRIRDPMGNYVQFYSQPWAANYDSSPPSGYYLTRECALYNPMQAWGELDGIRHISGFNQVVENTCTINGKANVVMRDVTRTGFNDYYTLELN